MTPTMVGALMSKARKLLQTDHLTLRDTAILDVVVFRCRAPGMRMTSISLRRIAQLAGCCKDTVIAAMRKLQEAGLLRTIKRRVKIPWMGTFASRQAVNVYEFLPPATESIPSTVIREQVSLPTVVRRETELERALGRLRVGQSATAPCAPG